MDNLKRYMLSLLLLGTLIGLARSFRSFFMTNFIEPIALLCWAAWRIVASVDQSFYWMILIVICAVLVIRLIPMKNDHSTSPAYTYKYESPNRVEYWQTLIRESFFGEEEGERLRGSLEKLFRLVAAKSGRIDPTAWEKNNVRGKLQPSVRAMRYLLPKKEIDETGFLYHKHDVLYLVPRRLRGWAGKFIHQDTHAIKEILEYLETEMELNHER
jgi:uncharacterized membrane protein